MSATDETEARRVAAGLSAVQREAIMRATPFAPTFNMALTDWNEEHPDIAEHLSDKIADPVCGELTDFGIAVRAVLAEAGTSLQKTQRSSQAEAPQ